MNNYYREEKDCLNCGCILVGKFCSNCGQENLQIKESIGKLMSHVLDDYFHFDHKLFRTLKPLFFQPGLLTREYMDGRRSQYLHPIRTYIFISIIYFLLLFQNSSHQNISVGITPNKQKEPANSAQGTQNQIMPPTTKDGSYKQYLASQQKLPVATRDGYFIKQYNKKAFSYQAKYGQNEGEEVLTEFEHNVPKMMFLMLPLFALILYLTFRKSKNFYVAHLIYAFHIHSFIFVTLAVVMLIQIMLPERWGLTPWLNFAETIYIIWYIYKSLRLVYQRTRFRTVTKMIGISFSYFFVFVFCMFAVLLFTALTLPT